MGFSPKIYVCAFAILLLISGCKPDSPGIDESGQDGDSTRVENGDTSNLENLITKYDPPGRVVWQKPELIINKMGEISHLVIADIGAGSGFFSRRLAQHAKKVIAVEVDPRFIHFMDSIKRVELSPQFQARLETRLATAEDSKLRKGEADIVLIVNTYIYFKDRVGYLTHLRERLPDNGKIIIVDFKKKRIPISYPTPGVRLELFEIENELLQAGFSDFESDDCSLDYQYIVIARK